MFKKWGFKLKKAQHVVELALFAPFIIIFIGVVSDMGFAMNSNHKFAASLYEATSAITPLNKIDKKIENTVSDIQNYTKSLAKLRSTPYWETIDVNYMQTGDLTFLIGTYKYTSLFNMMNTIIEFTPDAYSFMSIIPVNSAVLKQNPYNLSNSELNSLMAAYYTTSGTIEEEEEGEEEGEEEESEVIIPEASL